MTTIFLDVLSNIEPGIWYDPKTKKIAYDNDDQKERIVDMNRAILCKCGIRLMYASGCTMHNVDYHILKPRDS